MAPKSILGYPPVTLSLFPQLQWLRGRRVAASSVPAPYRELVLSRDSLTRRLKHRCRSRFRVRILDEGFAAPTAAERRWLGVRQRELCWVRQVLLLGDDEPWVLARTVMPLATVSGRFRRLRHLGRKPLGEVLFREAGWQRGPLRLGRCRYPDGQPGFARRSDFQHHQGRVLITELFFPALWHPAGDGQHAHRAA